LPRLVKAHTGQNRELAMAERPISIYTIGILSLTRRYAFTIVSQLDDPKQLVKRQATILARRSLRDDPCELSRFMPRKIETTAVRTRCKISTAKAGFRPMKNSGQLRHAVVSRNKHGNSDG